MSYRIVNDDERERARNWWQSAPSLRRRAVSIVQSLEKLFGPDEDLAFHDLKFTPTPEETCVGLVESPTGNGRLSLRFIDVRESLHAQIVVERQGVDELDRTTWTPVWAVNFASTGSAYVDSENEPSAFGIGAEFKGQKERAFFLLGMSINYALLAGPLRM